MIKVMIVDDEKLMLQGFIHSIHWIDHGYEIIGSAENAQAALEICKHQVPDIAVLDINMPGMNGLELIKVLKQLYPDMIVIILSSYDDFNFAREAIRLKAEEYLLKPEIEFEDILATMNKFKDRIQLKKNKILASDKIGKQKVLNELINGEIFFDSSFETKLKEIGIRLFKGNFKLCLIFVCTPIEIPGDKRLESGFFSVLEARLGISELFFQRDEFSCIFVLSEDAYENEKYQLLNFIKSQPQQIYMGISSCFNHLNGIPNTYLQACAALKERFYNDESFIYFDSSKISTFSAKDFQPDLRQVGSLLEVNNLKDLEIKIKEILAHIKEKHLPKEDVNKVLFEILFMLIKKLNGLEVNLDEILNINNFNPYYEISQFNSFKSLEIWFYDIFQKIYPHLSGKLEREYKT